MTDTLSPEIAYFSMEIGVDENMPTYSGGLGILAGDTIRAAADLSVPMVAVTLLHRKGYFRQVISEDGKQRELPQDWSIEEYVCPCQPRVKVHIEGQPITVRAWRRDVLGESGHTVSVVFLDVDVEENPAEYRSLTDHLYGGDDRHRLCQEVILGIGGVRMIDALGYTQIRRYHMNEGHSSLLTFELLRRVTSQQEHTDIAPEDVERVRQFCVFTTHTPVPAGHDKFSIEQARYVIGNHIALKHQDICCYEGKLNLTYLALNLSTYVNGVAHRHGEVSRLMFSSHEIDAITNGVHASTWTAQPMRERFDRFIPGWRDDNFSLRYALSIPLDEIVEAHTQSKSELIDHIDRSAGVSLDPACLTLGFARRVTPYKRLELMFTDPDRLAAIAEKHGPIQIVLAGKAHPRDEGGKSLIESAFHTARRLPDAVRVVFLPDYDMALARLLVAGVDVWLNTPMPPMEASGTSGMKAALNGVPSFSVLDGWWIEGCIEDVTGWAIGPQRAATYAGEDAEKDIESFYDKLDHSVAPLFYREHERFAEIMRHAIALNGSFFNTQRMLQQYQYKAYRPKDRTRDAAPQPKRVDLIHAASSTRVESQ